MAALIVFGVVTAIICWTVYRYIVRWRTKQQYLNDFIFPESIHRKLSGHYKTLKKPQIEDITEGLRDFLRILQPLKDPQATPPSKAIALAWQGFIEEGECYREFCGTLYGTEAKYQTIDLAAYGEDNPSLRMSWTGACAIEKINPTRPDRLPRMFCLDATLEIEDGYRYHIGSNPAEQTEGSIDVSKIGRHVELV